MKQNETPRPEGSSSANNSKKLFNSLSPRSDKEKHKYYCDALEWAWANRKEKDIKNIALTGNYGSGKSSILKTFQERNIEGLEFLKISLATFKEEKNFNEKHSTSNLPVKVYSEDETEIAKSEQESSSDRKNEQLRLVELSILQQIFYHEKSSIIPDSQFKKIRSLTKDQVKNATWLVSGLLCSSFLLFNFESFRTFLSLPEPLAWFEILIKIVILTVFLAIFYIFLRKIIEFSQKFTISKFNFQNLEIQIAEKFDKSILNNHLDEILYFFEATKYNVVIIEDLDRFEQTEIFTKLREINLLINNSKSINRIVIFIYAIRDEMFRNQERTKFFDFIIPVIPVINYSNSNEQLTKTLQDFNYKISTDLIDEVSFYVDDMRLLYNIVNEFHIYFQKFQSKEFMNKLFAIIVYKNIYPEDFVKLGRNSGMLYNNLVGNKVIWINQEISNIENNNSQLKLEIKELETSLPETLKELKSIYLLEYVQKTSGFRSFRINEEDYSIENMLEEDNFEKLLDAKVSYYGEYGGRQKFDFKFSDIEQKVNSERGYLDRKAIIEKHNTGRINSIRNELKHNEEEIRRVKNSKVKYLLKDKKMIVSTVPSKQEQLILLFIRNGYIAEDYLNYISYFYPGSITENDHWFLMNVRNETDSNFNYKLDEVHNIIKKISESEFEKSYILNYNLFDHLIKSKKYLVKKGIVFKQLSNESNDSIKFIKSYIEEGRNLDLFINELSKVWVNMWAFIEQDSSMAEEEKLNYYNHILNRAEALDIVKMSSFSSLEDFVSNKSDFLTLIEKTEKLLEIIDLLEVKFTSLHFSGVSEDIRKYVYENNNYAINPKMLFLMIQTFGEFNTHNFYKSNYASILSSNCSLLIEYINVNINKYIDSVYLKLEDNKEEKLDSLVVLLNHDELSNSHRESILLWTNTSIKEIDELNVSTELIDFLLSNAKAEANWSNIVFVYKENKNSFSETLMNFINNPDNTKTLVLNVFNSKEEDHEAFIRAFLLNEEINDKLYSIYIDSFPFTFSDLNFEILSYDKVKVLVEKRKIIFNLDNYNKLKLNFEPLQLIFAINNILSFFKMFPELEFSELELIELLKNSRLGKSDNIRLIELFEAKSPITELKALSLIGEISLRHSAIKLTSRTLTSILLTAPIKQEAKIELFVKNISEFTTDFIPEFLNSLGGKYKQLNEKGPMPSFKKSDSLMLFFDHLKEIGKISNIKPEGGNVMVTTFRL